MLEQLSVSYYGGYAILGTLFFVPPGADAQLTIPPPKPSMTTASPSPLPTATSDPLAIQALHKVIEASAGMKAGAGFILPQFYFHGQSHFLTSGGSGQRIGDLGNCMGEGRSIDSGHPERAPFRDKNQRWKR
jgi:hypothetical protein